MRISCPSCQSSYKIADEKVKGRTVKVRCRKCGMMIHVNEHGVANAAEGSSAQQAPQDAGAADAADGGGSLFSVLIAEGDQRDMGLQEIVDAYNSGQVTAETFVWAEGQPDWMPLGQVPAILEALNAASAAVDAVATEATAEPPMAAEPSPRAPAARPQPQAQPSQEAAGAQLFGGAGYQQPAEPAPAPQEPSPLFGAAAADPEPSPLFGSGGAAVREGRRAGSVDLFGAQASAGADEEVATSAPLVGPAPGAKPLGARDESSVLFSLTALTSAAGTPTAAGGPVGTNGKEDSGLIDLRALADKKTNAAPAAVAAPVGGGAILDAAPLLGSPLVDPALHQLHASDPPPARSGKGPALAIGLAVGGIAVAGAIVAVVWRLTAPEPVPVPTATTAESETTQVVTAPPIVPAATGSSLAAAPATGAPSATTEPTAKAVPKYTGRSSGGGSKTTSTKSGGSTGAGDKPASTPAAKPPPKANRCNCPPGDLACNMACAVK